MSRGSKADRTAKNGLTMSRRSLLAGGASLAVGVTVSGLLVSLPRPSTASETPLSAYLDLSGEGDITVYVGLLEMGQGSSTGLAMIVADELGADWSRVHVEFAANDDAFIHPLVYANEQVTGGSVSIVGFAEPMRKAAAAVRTMLIRAAADHLGEAPDTLRALDGEIRSLESGRVAAFAELIEAARQQPIPDNPPLTDVTDRTIVGSRKVRLDAHAKVDGTAVFGIDVDVPNMLYACVRQAPAFGSDVESFDDTTARAMDGMIGVFPVPNGLGVVAEHYWQAVQALEAIDITWSHTKQHWPNSDTYRDALITGLDQENGILVANHGSPFPGAVDPSDHQIVSTVYDVPFLAHATMEPMNATAHVKDGSVDIWAPTQTVTLDKQAVAAALDIGIETVQVNLTYAGGGFGRRGSSEYVVQAALLSRAVGRPVKVIWSREEDTQQDFYRPAFAARLDGAISKDGIVSALDIKVAGPGVWSYNRPLLVQHFNGVDELAVEGAYDFRYAVRNSRLRHVAFEPLQRVGYWRSIGYSHNVFFVESFIDELAHSVNADPYTVRHALLAQDPRSQTVLETAARQAGWFDPVAENRFLGIAFFATNRWQCRVAQVADISLDGDTIKINRMICVADIGQAVNPLSVEAQLQGAVLFGLSAALYGQIDIEDGAVSQSSFPDYPVLTLQDAPPVEVTIIEGGDAPGSVGEIGVPCATPALCNAIFAATGKRIRSLPLRKHGVI